MTVSIVPVQSSYKFGMADTLLLRSISDDLTNAATFFWQLGCMETPPLRVTGQDKDGKDVTVQDPDVFSGDELAIGNCSLSGKEYLAWSGANDDLPKRVVSQIGVTLA